jgi:hypothetical protein
MKIRNPLARRTDDELATSISELTVRRDQLAAARVREDVVESVDAYIGTARRVTSARLGIEAISVNARDVDREALLEVAAAFVASSPEFGAWLHRRTEAIVRPLVTRDERDARLLELDAELGAVSIELERRRRQAAVEAAQRELAELDVTA